jgi:hypothetical protein
VQNTKLSEMRAPNYVSTMHEDDDDSYRHESDPLQTNQVEVTMQGKLPQYTYSFTVLVN